MQFLLVLLCLSTFLPGLQANDFTDSSAIFATRMESEETLKFGAAGESGSHGGPQVLLRVDYKGLPASGKTDVTYWMVTGEAGMDEAGLPALRLVIAPYTEAIGATNSLPGGAFQTPILILRRDTGLGVDGEVTIYPVRISSTSKWEVAENFHSFSRIAVGLAGIRYIHMLGGSSFGGLQLGSLEGEEALSWDVTREWAAKIAVAGKLGLFDFGTTFRPEPLKSNFSTNLEYELLGRLEIVLRKRYALYAAVGRRFFLNSAAGLAITGNKNDENYDSGYLQRSNNYVRVGIWANF